MPTCVKCRPHFTQIIVPKLWHENVRDVSHPAASTADRLRPPECPGGPTSSLGHFNLQCLNFSICKMSIILLALSPVQTYWANQIKQCMEGLWEKKHKALYNLKVVSSSPILLYYPQRLYLSAEWLQIESLWVEEILYSIITQ